MTSVHQSSRPSLVLAPCGGPDLKNQRTGPSLPLLGVFSERGPGASLCAGTGTPGVTPKRRPRVRPRPHRGPSARPGPTGYASTLSESESQTWLLRLVSPSPRAAGNRRRRGTVVASPHAPLPTRPARARLGPSPHRTSEGRDFRALGLPLFAAATVPGGRGGGAPRVLPLSRRPGLEPRGPWLHPLPVGGDRHHRRKRDPRDPPEPPELRGTPRLS